jgi:hypothetical protein
LPSFFSFALNQGIEFCSKRIFYYIEEIYYSGIGLSAVAILAALTASIAWTVLFTAGAALCFGLAGWAYRARNAKLSYEYHLVNAQYFLSQQTGEAHLLKMRELEKKIDELKLFIERLTQEISSHRAINEEQSKKIESLNQLIEESKELRSEVASLKERLRRLVGSAGDLRGFSQS